MVLWVLESCQRRRNHVPDERGIWEVGIKLSGSREEWYPLIMIYKKKYITYLVSKQSRYDIPKSASAIKTRRHCMVSTLCNFLRSRRYSRAYVWPSDRWIDSTFALGCLSTFLMRASSSEVTS